MLIFYPIFSGMSVVVAYPCPKLSLIFHIGVVAYAKNHVFPKILAPSSLTSLINFFRKGGRGVGGRMISPSPPLTIIFL